MSSEPVSDADASRRGLKKPCSFSIEDILSSPAETSPQVLVPLCLRGILDCAPKGLCELESIPASSLQEEEEEEEELEGTGCSCCCCSHTSARSLQDSPSWLGECLGLIHSSGLMEGLVQALERGKTWALSDNIAPVLPPQWPQNPAPVS